MENKIQVYWAGSTLGLLCILGILCGMDLEKVYGSLGFSVFWISLFYPIKIIISAFLKFIRGYKK